MYVPNDPTSEIDQCGARIAEIATITAGFLQAMSEFSCNHPDATVDEVQQARVAMSMGVVKFALKVWPASSSAHADVKTIAAHFNLSWHEPPTEVLQ